MKKNNYAQLIETKISNLKSQLFVVNKDLYNISNQKDDHLLEIQKTPPIKKSSIINDLEKNYEFAIAVKAEIDAQIKEWEYVLNTIDTQKNELILRKSLILLDPDFYIILRSANIKKLEISNSNIPSLSSDIKYFSSLEELSINGCKLGALPIEIGHISNLRHLDLSGNSITELPHSISQLIQLESLNLEGNQLQELPNDIIKLVNLKELILVANNIKFLPLEIHKLISLETLDLSFNTELSKLPPNFRNLKSLRELYISDSYLFENNVEDLLLMICELTNLELLTIVNIGIKSIPAEIKSLKHLRDLDLHYNNIIDLPSDFAQLKSLKNLDLIGNKFSKIPECVYELNGLETLYMSENAITYIDTHISNLKNLRTLSLGIQGEGLMFSTSDFDATNLVKELPITIKELDKLEVLDLTGNPLSIPEEILSRTHEPAAIINYYWTLKFLGLEKKPLHECKINVVGQGSVGKTSIIEQILNYSFDKEQSKTDGISIKYWQNQEIKLSLWDFGGQEIMHATHQFFLTKRSLYLLVLDSRLTQEENRVEYWLKIIQSFGGESPVLIVGNKIDQHPLDIDRTGLQKKYPNIVGILETSAATGAGIEALKTAITEQVNNLPHVRDLLPETWFTVKTKLEGLGRESNFITHDKYLELCAENEVSDEISQRTLIGFLHDLGVVLHFQDDPRLEALGILNPQWVTNGVYKILNSHELFQNKGVLPISMLNNILNIDGYPRDKRLFIVDMMKKFELCYDIEPDKTFLVPDLLPKDEPAELKFNGVPAFEYAYPVLPSSVITRFIVRMNQKIDDSFVWRTGVVLKIGDEAPSRGNKALVKADIEDRKITIAIDGVEHTRRDALSAIRFQLDEIHGSIKGLEPQKRVPIPEAPEAEPLDYDYLLQLERDGFEELPVKDGNRLVKVNVRKLLSGVVSEADRRQTGGNITNIFISGDVKDSNIIAGDENETSR